MARSADREALEEARLDVETAGRAFAVAARPAVQAALRRALSALAEANPEWHDRLRADQADAFERASTRAIDAAGEEVQRRLEATDVWLAPLIAPGVAGPSEIGWDGALPEWVSGLLRRFSSRARGTAELGDLDDPGNRIWVAIAAAARPLDPVLREFGLPPSSAPDIGGGHYGLQPRTKEQLDPSGELAALWRRYRLAYARYEALREAG